MAFGGALVETSVVESPRDGVRSRPWAGTTREILFPLTGVTMAKKPPIILPMAEYMGPATDNEADVIATMDGRKVPDTYATGDSNMKMSDPHAKRIHNDIHYRYGSDTECD